MCPSKRGAELLPKLSGTHVHHRELSVKQQLARHIAGLVGPAGLLRACMGFYRLNFPPPRLTLQRPPELVNISPLSQLPVGHPSDLLKLRHVLLR